jgi:hypothetical protein
MNRVPMIKARESAMKNASHYRALASLCRQQAAYNPAHSWHLLGQAERWEHLAEQELASHFKECNATSASDPTDTRATPDAKNARWEALSLRKSPATGTNQLMAG